jgi:hypothetical protein
MSEFTQFLATRRRLARLLCAISVAAFGGAGAPALAARSGLPGPNEGPFNPASHTEGNHCFNSFGVDLNALFGVSEQIITATCVAADSGEFVMPLGFGWYTNTSWQVVPEGFVPVAPTPMGDFLAKLVSVTLVVDAGTRHERTMVYPASSVTKLVTLDQKIPGSPAYPGAEFLTKLAPPALGAHTADIAWLLNADHWDGLGADPNENLLRAGTVGGPRRTFSVTPGATQSG